MAWQSFGCTPDPSGLKCFRMTPSMFGVGTGFFSHSRLICTSRHKLHPHCPDEGYLLSGERVSGTLRLPERRVPDEDRR